MNIDQLWPQLLELGLCGMLGRWLHYHLTGRLPEGWRGWLSEIPTMVALAAIGHGVADVAGWDSYPQWAAQIFAAWAGLRLLELILKRISGAK